MSKTCIVSVFLTVTLAIPLLPASATDTPAVRTLKKHGGVVTCVAFSPDGQLVASGLGEPPQQTVASVPLLLIEFRVVRKGKKKMYEVELWDAKTGELTRTLPGHSNPVKSVVFSPDGKMLASSAWQGSNGLEVKLWDLRTGAPRWTRERKKAITIAFWPNAGTLAIANLDETVELWDTQTGEVKRTVTRPRVEEPQPSAGDPRAFGLPGRIVTRVALLPDGRTVVSDVVRVEKEEQVGQEHRKKSVMESLSALKFFYEVNFWDTQTGESRSVTIEPGESIEALSPDGKTVVTSRRVEQAVAVKETISPFEEERDAPDTDRKKRETVPTIRELRLRDAETGALKQTLSERAREGTRPELQALQELWGTRPKFIVFLNAVTVASLGQGERIELWDARTGKLQQTLKGHRARVLSVAISPDSKTVASGSADQTVRLWEVSGSK